MTPSFGLRSFAACLMTAALAASVIAREVGLQQRPAQQASPTMGKGTVNLTSVSGAAAGTFSLTLDAVPGTGASGSLTVNGSFNIKF